MNDDQSLFEVAFEEGDQGWFHLTGHCGRCGLEPNACDCAGRCGCAQLHGYLS